ncbi:MAG: ATP-binding protein [Nanoarchaeota archaeon]|nr:ATP-binding protein [Nanoarchaeota archaeon]MBU0962818.1 ATP-binding protein [Nanoarchaeota archaeon]
MYEIIIGRTESEKRKMGLEGTIFIGKMYVRMGQTTSLSNKVLLDVVNPHVILICGKRGGGKSYSLAVIAEEISNLPEEISQNLSVLILDTMGIFWTMKYPNEREEDLLKQWDLKPTATSRANIFIPKGYFDYYKDKKFPCDFPFTISPSELSALDWCSVFNLGVLEPISILADKVIDKLQDTKGKDYDIKDIINEIKKDTKTEDNIKNGLENLFVNADSWGLFDKNATPIKDIIDRGKISIVDISIYKDWNVKALVASLISKKLLLERMVVRKLEEMKDIEKGYSYFFSEETSRKEQMPLVWILIDEMHEFLPKNRITPATDAFVQLLREGRQPGISLVMATQQPGEIHMDAITQSDIVISHRITARKDIEALNNIMQTYLGADILRYLNELPKLPGSAIILDDNSERIYPMKVRPRFSWHGGESPKALHIKREELSELGL